jgi:hypothetical protein
MIILLVIGVVLYWAIGVVVMCRDWTKNFDLDLTTFFFMSTLFCWCWPIVAIGNILPEWEFSEIIVLKRRDK